MKAKVKLNPRLIWGNCRRCGYCTGLLFMYKKMSICHWCKEELEE